MLENFQENAVKVVEILLAETRLEFWTKKFQAHTALKASTIGLCLRSRQLQLSLSIQLVVYVVRSNQAGFNIFFE